MAQLEICVDSVQGLNAAIEGGADRIELCSALALGGLSPSLALLEAAVNAPIPVYVMVRPRSGDFQFSEQEVICMEKEIAQVRRMGFSGVVLGAGSAPGLDWQVLKRLVLAAGDLGKTLHRVVDLLPRRSDVLPQSRALGFERILTSGGARSAFEGVADLAELVSNAPAGLSIMPGSGVTTDNITTILTKSGADEIHTSASIAIPSGDARLVDLGFASEQRKETSADLVRALKSLAKEQSAGRDWV